MTATSQAGREKPSPRRGFRRARTWLIAGAIVLGVALVGLGLNVARETASLKPGGKDAASTNATESVPTTSAAPGALGGGAVTTSTLTADRASSSATAGAASDPGSSSTNNKSRGIGEPPVDRQPKPPSNPTKALDSSFGEKMFPKAYGNLTQVSAFSSGDDEVAAVYKRAGDASFDLLRLTIRRTSSQSAANAALKEVQELYSGDRRTFTWGGRSVAQATAPGGTGEDPSLSLTWAQGRYVIDAVVFPPYTGGIERARAGLLEVVGRLPY